MEREYLPKKQKQLLVMERIMIAPADYQNPITNNRVEGKSRSFRASPTDYSSLSLIPKKINVLVMKVLQHITKPIPITYKFLVITKTHLFLT